MLSLLPLSGLGSQTAVWQPCQRSAWQPHCATALHWAAEPLHCTVLGRRLDYCTPLLHRLIDGPGPPVHTVHTVHTVHNALPALYISWLYLPEMNGPSHCTAQQQSCIFKPAAATLGLETAELGLNCRLSLLCTAGTQSAHRLTVPLLYTGPHLGSELILP